MDNMPIRPIQHQIRDQAENIFADFVLAKNWIIFGRQNQNDYGVDCDVQVVDAKQVSGFHFMAQLKGTKSIEWVNDKYNFYLEKTKVNYLHELNIPSILILVDTTKRELYWKSPFDYEENEKQFVYRFTKMNTINGVEFDNFIWNHRVLSSDQLQEEIVHYHQQFLGVKELADWNPDYAYLLEGDQISLIKGLYSHVQRLRMSVGLVGKVIIPWQMWHIRSRTVVDDGDLCFEIFLEMFEYLKKLYFEALDIVKLRSENKEYWENVWEYLNSLGSNYESAGGPAVTVERGHEEQYKVINNLQIENVLRREGIMPLWEYLENRMNKRYRT